MEERTDRERWNAKHAAQAGELDEPDPFLAAALKRLGAPPGGPEPPRALEAACGRGRNALALARAGWRVEAWDVSDVAVEALAGHAARAGLAVTARRVDLTAAAWPVAGPFDLVVVVSWLDRAVLPRLLERVAPGGALVLATFTTDRRPPRPRDAWCLRPGELARGLPGFATLLCEERNGRAGLLARRVA